MSLYGKKILPFFSFPLFLLPLPATPERDFIDGSRGERAHWKGADAVNLIQVLIGHANRERRGGMQQSERKERKLKGMLPGTEGEGEVCARADLNCATQLLPLPFDRSNAPLKKKVSIKEGICGYENVSCTKGLPFLCHFHWIKTVPTLFSRYYDEPCLVLPLPIETMVSRANRENKKKIRSIPAVTSIYATEINVEFDASLLSLCLRLCFG